MDARDETLIRDVQEATRRLREAREELGRERARTWALLRQAGELTRDGWAVWENRPVGRVLSPEGDGV